MPQIFSKSPKRCFLTLARVAGRRPENHPPKSSPQVTEMMIDPTLLAVMTGLIGAIGAMIWSFLMASKIAAPRAAAKSKLLLVNILTGATPEDQEILERVRGSLVRPEVEKVLGAVSDVPKELEIDSDALSEALAPLIEERVFRAFNQVKAQEARGLQKQLEELGLDSVVDEAKGVIAEQLPPEMVQAQRLLNMKVSKRYASEHPVEAQALEFGKLYVMQYLQGLMPQNGAATTSKAVSASSNGFGVR